MDDGNPIDRDLTIYHVAELKPRLLAWVEQGCPPLDLSATAECDSAGLQLLLAARRSALARGTTLTLTHAGAAVQDAVRRVGLEHALVC